jgi:[ribosomal protein S18]-alanine N-acetyltransferase
LNLETQTAIRSAALPDIPAILQLERASETAAHWSDDQYRRALTGGSPERITLVVDHVGNISGFLVARAVDSQWELENIVVAKDVRRRGVGTLLLNRLVKLARERSAAAIFLEVRSSNEPARALYTAHGFELCGLRTGYYVAPVEDATVYRLQL